MDSGWKEVPNRQILQNDKQTQLSFGYKKKKKKQKQN
jgi:hypothetical protein